MANLDRDLERFLRKELFAERADGKAVVKLVLFHCPAGSKTNEVETYKYREGMSSDELPPLIEEIVSRAQADADGSGGVQRFLLRVFVKGDSNPVGRFSFRLRGSDDDFDGEFDDAPSQKGLLTQLMRHNEAIMRVTAAMFGTATSAMARQLESSNDRLERMTAQRHNDFELMEKLRSDQHSRDIEAYQVEKSEQRKAEIFEKIAVLAPVLVNRIVGQKMLPSGDPTVISLKEIVSTLDSTQFEKILAALKPDQAIALLEIVQSFQKQEEAKNQERAAKENAS